MYYTVYKITNKLNNKFYIGVHKTDNLDDGYMGSGKYLQRSQEKYGIENFDKEILEVFDNPEDMFNMESELVNEEFVKREDTYNLKEGGYGGWDHINSSGEFDNHSHEHMALMRSKVNLDNVREGIKLFFENSEKVKKRSERFKKSKKIFFEKGGKSSFYGREHTPETKAKMSQSHKFKHDGDKNSQYGTMWIYNLGLKESKKIKKEEFQHYKEHGWTKGRKIKF